MDMFTSTPAVASVALMAATGLIWYMKPPPKRVNAPLLESHLNQKSREQKFMFDAKGLLMKAKEMGTPVYRVTTMDGQEVIVFSQKYLEELRELTDDQLDFNEGMRMLLAGDHTGMGEPTPLALHVIKSDLTPSLGRLMPIISEEIDLAMAKVISTNVTPYRHLLEPAWRSRVESSKFTFYPLKHHRSGLRQSLRRRTSLSRSEMAGPHT